MGVSKRPLYFGNDISDLQSKAKLGDTSKVKVKVLCTSSEKVFKEAVIQKDLGDEEKAYVFFFKYLECVQKIQKNSEFKKDSKYFTSMYNIQKNSKKAIETLEVLATSLESRYEEKNVAERLAKLDLDLLNTESKSSKLDENSNENEDTPIQNEIAKLELKDYLISPRKLQSLINEKSTTFFVLDTRTAEDYHNSFINLPNTLNVPETYLKPGTTATSVGRNVKIEFRNQWERRTSVDMLVICDWTSYDFDPGKPVTVLRDALTKWDLGAKYKNPPFLLEGGFQRFLMAYPHSVTNPKARAPSEPRITRPTAPSLDFDYPDLDSGFMITPSPSPSHKSQAALNSGAIKIYREPQTQSTLPSLKYPSLADLNSFTPKSVPRATYPNSTTLKEVFTPNIPDRATKPDTTVNSKVLPEIELSNSKDDFNEAKQSFDIDRSDSSSLRSTSGSSLLNQAVLDQSNGNNLPQVDRGTKKNAVIKYSGVTGDKLDDLDNMEDVLKTQSDIANQSLAREKEKLDLENKWEFLRLKREAEHETSMRQMIVEEQDKLVDELERLKNIDKERDDVEHRLKEELEAVKEQLKEKDEKEKKYLQSEELRRIEWEKEEERRKVEKAKEDEIRRKDREKLAMMEAVDRKRKERKEMDKERREEERRNSPMRLQQPGQRDSPSRQVQDPANRGQGGRGAGAVKQKLRDEDDGRGSGGGGLKRSFSSPNIAQMLEQEDKGLPSVGYSGVPVPKFDRQQKPSLISSRNFAGVWGTQKPGLTGLKNLGNTCYMNSILQCVSNTPPLAHYFISRSYEEDLNSKYSETRGHVAVEFSEVLKNIWSSQFKSISPSDLKQMVGKFKPEFAGRDQQDSHEFASKLLEWLHSDTNRVVRPTKEPEQNNKDSKDKSAAKRHWRNYLERNQSIIVQLFCGQTRSTVKCFSCVGESVTYREFTNLTLPLPETHSRVNLRDCFEEFLREERIDEFKCDRCKKTGKASKKTDIVKLPPLLVIHLSRFYQDGMYTRKKQNSVNFDLKNLNLGQFAIDGFENKFFQFNLYAVSNHFGSLEGGHYTAYCSSNVLKRWHKFDDQDVSTMDSADVVTPAAYILFYSAIEGQTSLPPLG
eukprot:GFUD01008966.1.p1 GENE.GFUD01008966.1~~GFUD01008966.1.p1  ORF type:complete len:1103 (+),score=340.51 GFUD01008966.1:377-3685(+)